MTGKEPKRKPRSTTTFARTAGPMPSLQPAAQEGQAEAPAAPVRPAPLSDKEVILRLVKTLEAL